MSVSNIAQQKWLASGAMLRATELSENWTFAELTWTAPEAMLGFSALEWLPATVPGHVHLDLVRNGVLSHPFERMHELGCQWVDERSFVYRVEFDWAPSAEHPQRVLQFQGLDTVCRILLNDQLIAEHDNMFVPLEVDVSTALRSGKNRLEILFAPATVVGNERLQSYFAAEALNAPIERFEERSFVRKAQYMFGWDWGPRLVSCGVWKPVHLLEFSARLGDIHVRQEHRTGGGVRVHASAEVLGRGVVIQRFAREAPRVGDGVVADIDTPELWYPVGLGPQPLFELVTYLCPPEFDIKALDADPDRADQQLQTIALDVRTTRIGLRRLELLQKPDGFGESFEFEVNGERLWAMGANWIPDHSFPSQVSREQLARKLKIARAAGMNMLRVWGGGLYESDDFYELCDELGILVWQDFPFACAYYPDTGNWPKVIELEARANIRRLRNHPSLAVWCGNNENLQMFEQRWGKPEHQPPRLFGEQLYDKTLPAVLRELDPERPYIPSSPFGGETANSGGFGDQHYWDVWHGRGDWKHYRDSTARFSSEYGFASSCSLKNWEQIFRNEAVDAIRKVPVRDPIVRWHDKTKKGYETFLGFTKLHYPESGTLEDWIYYSQLNQRDALRVAIEHYRRSEFCKGSLIWQLNDCWPVQSWSLIDSSNQWKAAFYELFRLYAPLLLSIDISADDRVSVWGILDNAPEQTVSAEVRLEAFSLLTGQPLRSSVAPMQLTNGERKLVLEMSLTGMPARETVLVASSGERRAVRLLAEPKELVLQPASTLYVSSRRGRLSVQTETPLLDLLLTDAAGTANFRENFVTMPSSGVFDIAYAGDGTGIEARSLAGVHPCVYYDIGPDSVRT